MQKTGMGIVLGAFAFLLPFLTTDQLFYGSISQKFFLTIALVGLLLLWAAVRLWKKGSVTVERRWLLGSLVLVSIAGYLSMFFGVYPERSWWADILRSTGMIYLSHIALLAVIAGSFLNTVDWSFIRKSIALSGGLFALLTLAGTEGFALGGKFLGINLDNPGLTIGNGTFAGAYLMLALIVALIELSRSWEQKKWRWALIVSSLLILLSPLLITLGLGAAKVDEPLDLLGSARASSFSAYALLIFLGGAYLIRRFLKEKTKRALFAWGALWVIAIAAGLSLLFMHGSFVQETYIKTSSAARIYVWEGAKAAIAERPLFGWGPENFNHAFESHFDNRLYLSENYAEVWFDKAHNVFIDTLVTWGYAGVIAFALLIISLWLVALRAWKEEKIGYTEYLLLSAFPVAHILQSQTAFDTTATYALLGILLGYLLFLEKETVKDVQILAKIPSKVLAGVAAIIMLASVYAVFFKELPRHQGLFMTVATTSGDERLKFIETSVARHSNFELLRLSSSSFIKTILVQMKNIRNPEDIVTVIAPFLDLYEAAYVRYLQDDPTYYRARMNYAYLLLTRSALGDDRIAEAQAIIKDSYDLSPSNPLTYALDALAYFYAGDVAQAKETIGKGIALNEDIQFSKAILAYFERQERNPRAVPLNLENL